MALKAEDYRLMTHPTPVGLADLVRDLLQHGYQLHGDTLINPKEGGYAQAMVMLPEETAKSTDRRQA